MAERHGDRDRAALHALASPNRQFLTFDGRGDGRAVEVLGDLASADRTAVLVPGSDTTLDTCDTRGAKPYSTVGGGVRALYDELHRRAPGTNVTVVAWLGYATPDTVSPDVITTGRAEEGAAELRSFIAALRRTNRGAPVALLCHTYGSAVCGRAASDGGLAVADIAVFDSPGMGVDSASDLGIGTRVWAGLGAADWIDRVPNASVELLGMTVGLGTDPVSAGFGARPFAAGDGGHSDYLRPGSPSLRSLALIALDRAAEVPRG